jgi:hypothetical protein
MGPDATITITATMGERWVPHFLGLLREMERLGAVGSSRTLRFFADGDGDYRPRFEWDTGMEPAGPAVVEGPNTDALWDAG